MRPFVVAIVLSMFAAPALAAQGEVCQSAPAPMPNILTNDVVFQCKAAGDATIPDLYAKGWRVVSVFSQMAPAAGSPMGQMEWVVVIEKP